MGAGTFLKPAAQPPRTPAMIRSAPPQAGWTPASALEEMPENAFVKGWQSIVGEPPAIKLESRFDMVNFLVASVPVAFDRPASPDAEAS